MHGKGWVIVSMLQPLEHMLVIVMPSRYTDSLDDVLRGAGGDSSLFPYYFLLSVREEDRYNYHHPHRCHLPFIWERFWANPPPELSAFFDTPCESQPFPIIRETRVTERFFPIFIAPARVFFIQLARLLLRDFIT